MKALVFCLIPAALAAGPLRFARLGLMDGPAEVQVHAADSWKPAVRNLPLVESSFVRTGAASRLEIELDEGSALRLVGDSQAGFSDYTRLSTGQRVTLVTLERGLAYFTGEPAASDALILAVPGAQIALRRGSRVRLEARAGFSQIAMVEGSAKFSSPGAELELQEGQMARVEVPRSARFFLYREIPPLDHDHWSEERDKLLASSAAAKHALLLHGGLQDLDEHGAWIETQEHGTVWKPQTAPGWVPFREGSWKWYDGIGYTWIAGEPWGWLPSHYGRWIDHSTSGWVWTPGQTDTFKPGDVYWLRDRNWLGWGPLAPGERWEARGTPKLYLKANTTFARWTPDTPELIPGDTPDKPRDPLAASVFVIAPPSPALSAARLEVARPESLAGGAMVSFPEARYPAPEQTSAQAPQRPPDPDIVTLPGNDSPPPPDASAGPVPPPVPVPTEIYYPVPIYTGVIVVNPPERGDRPDRRQPERPRPVTRPPVSSTPDPPKGPIVTVPPPVVKPADPRPPSIHVPPVPSAPAAPPVPAAPRIQPPQVPTPSARTGEATRPGEAAKKDK